MRVALVGAEFEENLALRYLWGALAKAGHEVLLVTFNARDDLEIAAKQLAESHAELAGFSMVFTYRAREFSDLATRARELGYKGHIVAGGHFATMHAEELLRDVTAFDSVGCGEGETLICELAQNLAKLNEVRGLTWRSGSSLLRNNSSVKPTDLDSLAYPVRKIYPDRYLGFPVTNILASRGCTHNCDFCSIAAWHRVCGGPRFRLRSVPQIALEMAEQYQRGVRIFNFHDDNFLLHSKREAMARVEELAQSLRSHGVGKIAFAIKARPGSVDPDLFSLLKRAGLFRVFLGIEAGTSQALDQLGRCQSPDDNARALDVVQRLDVHACFNLLLLNPDSTLEDLRENVSFLRRHPRNPMNFCRTEVYSGTPLEARLRSQGRLLGDYWGWDYVIADPRAQLAFEILYPVFATRNYGEACLHHTSMHVDYELQLLNHFYGKHDDLHGKVKRYVQEVNLNTCHYLEQALNAIAASRVTAGRAQGFVHDLRAQVEKDNAILVARGQELVEEMQLSVQEREHGRSSRRSWESRVALVGIAATMTLAGLSCREKSHPTEMAAAPSGTDAGPPPDDAATHFSEMVASPPPVQDAGSLDAGDRDAGVQDASSVDSGRIKGTVTPPPKAPPKPRTHMHEMAPMPFDPKYKKF